MPRAAGVFNFQLRNWLLLVHSLAPWIYYAAVSTLLDEHMLSSCLCQLERRYNLTAKAGLFGFRMEQLSSLGQEYGTILTFCGLATASSVIFPGGLIVLRNEIQSFGL